MNGPFNSKGLALVIATYSFKKDKNTLIWQFGQEKLYKEKTSGLVLRRENFSTKNKLFQLRFPSKLIAKQTLEPLMILIMFLKLYKRK